MFGVSITNNLYREVRYYYNCMFVSSIECTLIIVKGNDKEPTKSVGCWIMEKQVTSNVTQLSLPETLEKLLGRQVWASFSLIRSFIFVMKQLHLR